MSETQPGHGFLHAQVVELDSLALGALLDPAPRWRVHAYAAGINQFVGERDTPRSIGVPSSTYFTGNREGLASNGANRKSM